MFWMAPTFSIAFFPFAIRHWHCLTLKYTPNTTGTTFQATLPYPTPPSARYGVPSPGQPVRYREREEEQEKERERNPQMRTVAKLLWASRSSGVLVYPYSGYSLYRSWGGVSVRFLDCAFLGFFLFFFVDRLLACGRVNGAGSWDWKLKIYKCKILKILSAGLSSIELWGKWRGYSSNGLVYDY